MTESDPTSLPHRTGDAPKPPLAPVSPRALSADLRALAEHFHDGPVRLAEVVELLKGRGYRFLIALLGLPLLTPIPLPGISTVIGRAIALIGLRLALGQKPHLPQS